MKIKGLKKWCYVASLVIGMSLFTGCNEAKEFDEVEQKIQVTQEEVQKDTQKDIQKEEILLEDTEITEAEESTEVEIKEESEFTFADISNREFYFSSGAGAWYTVLYIHEDGSFDGHYQDSDMGDTGEGYPNGVQYACDFSGQFTQPVKIDDWTYSVKIDSISYQNEPETEEILDGILYRYSSPYGLEGDGELHIYLPGSQLSNLPEMYLSWIHWELAEVTDGELPFYGLYNVEAGNGFSSYVMVADTGNQQDAIDAELAEIETKSKEMEEKLSSGILNQMELNAMSAEWYKLWDDEINSIWARLKETLDEETFAAVKEEQISWIAYKESEVTAAGVEFGDGSMRPLEENTLAAEMTRERVYELIELLR